MKKLLAYCLLAVLPSLKAQAYDFESDGIYYTITGSNTVSVVSGDYAYAGNITIPQAVGLSGETYLVTGIGDQAFISAVELESINLPEGLTFIGYQAFYQSGVKTVSLPSTLSSIGASAFRECYNLKGIVLPDALKVIKESAFRECLGLNTISFGSQTTTIESDAFRQTGVENLVIPKTTTLIENNAFYQCWKLKTLIINDAPVVIEHDAFYACTQLENIDLGNAIVELKPEIYTYSYPNNYKAYGAFRECTSLNNVILPNSLKTVGGGAFIGCSRLSNVTLPNNLESIEPSAFEDCAITHINIPAGVTTIGCSAFLNNPLIEIELPEGLEEIGGYAFCNTNISALVIPQSVKSIGWYAFRECNYLKSIKIENAATNLISSFYGCKNLEEVDLGNALESLSSFEERWETTGCFQGCTNLKSIVLPNSIPYIGVNCFSGCTKLESIKFPNNLIHINSYAFSGCTSLKDIDIPNKVKYIDNNAFDGCWSLRQVTLPSSLINIGKCAFRGCSYLSSIVIPETVTYIDDEAFQGCSSLNELEIDNAITGIGNNAFASCTNLKSVNLGRATSLRYNAFYCCTQLESIVIPNSVEYIEWSIFQGCSALRNVVIGSGIKIIENSMFKDCSKLVNIEFGGNEITTIRGNCFENCRSLKKIDLPASLTTIEMNCFSGCSSLAQIYSNATTPPTIYDTSFPDYENPTLHVPSSALTDYTRADYWKKFEKVIAIGSEPKATAEEIAALETLLSEAQTLYNNAVEGTEPGNYRPGAKAAFKAVINEVSARISEDMLTEDVEDCTDLLNTAIRSFRNKQVKNDYQTDNTLAFASSLKASRGDEFQLPIEMNNVNEISGVQFDLYLPEGLMLSKDENEDFEIELSERASNQHVVSARIMDDGALRVLVTSSQNATFTGNSGTLLTLKLFPQSTMEAGDYDVELKNIVLTDPQATRYAAEDIKSVISVSTYTLGDVNNDTYIDVADLTGVVLFILENADASLVFNAADMDGNGVVEVNDYAALVNVILAQDEPQNSRLYGMNDAMDYPNVIGLSDLTLNEKGEGELLVTLHQKDYAYSGIQFDLYLPEGIMLNEEESVASNSRHGLWMQKHTDGNYRIICSSMMNAELNTGVVIRLQVKAADNIEGNYQVMADNVVLSDVNAKRHEVANANAHLTVGGETTGITTIGISTQKNVFDMQGRRVDAVKKGVYVVNGKKVVVQ